MHDLLHACRSLRKSPGFMLIAVLTLALGLGANTAIFSYVYALFLQPLPFPNQARVTAVIATVQREQVERRAFSLPDFRDYRAQATQNFAALSGYATDSLTLTGDGAAERVPAELVDANYFSILGVNAALGRVFVPEEDAAPGGPSVVLISDELWRSRFGARPGLVGQTIRLNDTDCLVVGVLPAGFRGVTDSAKAWIPLAMTGAVGNRDAWNTRGWRWHDAIGLLKPGATLAAANAELAAAAKAIAQANPDASKDYGAYAKPLREELFGDLRTPLFIVLGAVAFVQLITCVNVANLLLVRLNARRTELSVRAALGASRTQLARIFLAESLVLGLAGGAAALVLSQWAIDALHAFNPVELPAYIHPALNWPVFVFTTGIALASTLAVGLLPAWEAARRDLVTSLKEAGRTGAPGNGRVRHGLMAAEIALALALLTGAGLMVKSYRQLSRLDPGYRTANLLAAALDMPAAHYNAAQIRTFQDTLLARVRALPGVRAASLATDSPLDDNDSSSTYVAAADNTTPEKTVFRGFYHYVTPDFFTTMGLGFRAGATFDAGVKFDGEKIAVISESLAKRYWPNGAIGRVFRSGARGTGAPVRIVGVVNEAKYRGLPENQTRDPDLYFPMVQSSRRSFEVIVLAEHSAGALLPDLRRAVTSLDAGLPLFNTGVIEERIARKTAGPRFTTQLIGLFSGVALVLACLGIYGVVSFNVGLRTQEIGIRQALGASRADIFRLVVLGTGRVAAVGVGTGLALSLGLSQLLRSQLYEVAATDPSVYLLGAALLGGVSLLATWLPARRAARVDPLVALRAE